MSHPSNGDESGNQSGGFNRPSSLGQGWEQDQQQDADQQVDAPFDNESNVQGDEQNGGYGNGQSGQSDDFQSAEHGYTDGASANPQFSQPQFSQPQFAQPESAQPQSSEPQSSQASGSQQSGSQQPTYSRSHEPVASYSRPDQQEPAGYGQSAGHSEAPGHVAQGGPDDRQQQTQQGWAQPQQQSGGYGAPQGGFGQQSQQGTQGQQGAQGTQNSFGQQAQAQVGQVVSGAGDGVGALISDFAFKKSLTEKLASLVFLVTVVWAVLHFLANLVFNFGSRGDGQYSVSNMGTGSALVNTLADLAWLILVVGVARILLELAVNVAKIAGREKK